MDLTTTYLGLELANPIVSGSCPLGASLDTIRHLEEAGAAAIVLPSLFEEEIMGAVQAQMEMESAGAGFAACRGVSSFHREREDCGIRGSLGFGKC